MVLLNGQFYPDSLQTQTLKYGVIRAFKYANAQYSYKRVACFYFKGLFLEALMTSYLELPDNKRTSSNNFKFFQFPSNERIYTTLFLQLKAEPQVQSCLYMYKTLKQTQNLSKIYQPIARVGPENS